MSLALFVIFLLLGGFFGIMCGAAGQDKEEGACAGWLVIALICLAIAGFCGYSARPPYPDSITYLDEGAVYFFRGQVSTVAGKTVVVVEDINGETFCILCDNSLPADAKMVKRYHAKGERSVFITVTEDGTFPKQEAKEKLKEAPKETKKEGPRPLPS